MIDVQKLNARIEEADVRLIIHAFNAAQSGIQQIVVVSQDTDVQILCLHYWKRLASFGAKELWVTAGIGDSSRYIPTHTLAEKLGDGKCNVLPALHTLTGCDYTSKFGTKSAAVKANTEMFLKDFGSIEGDIEKQVVSAEQYLVQVKKKGSTFKTCDELRDFLYHHSKTSDLPQTSHELKMHILRALYNQSNETWAYDTRRER